MQDFRYFGTYVRFYTPSNKYAGALMGRDNIVGDRYTIEFTTVDDVNGAWLKNRFGAYVGYLDQSVNHELLVMQARGNELAALLSFVAITDDLEPSAYWGEVAVIAFDPKEDAFETYISAVSEKLGASVRPNLDLGEEGVNKIIGSKGEWVAKETIPFPSFKEKGTAVVKDSRGIGDNFVEQARKNNKAILIGGWACIIICVVLIVLGVKSCVGL